MSRPLLVLLQCLAAVAVIGNLSALGFWVRDRVRGAEKRLDGEAVVPAVKAESENKAVVIRMNADTASSYGVEIEPAREDKWRERVVAFGRVVPNPNATYEIRSPFPGTLGAAGSSWPAPGQTIRPGQPLARVTVRVTPTERLDLQVRYSEACLKKTGAEEVVGLRKALVMRLSKASAGSVGLRELEDAQVQLSEAETQLNTAAKSVEIWKAALDEIDSGKGNGNGPWTKTLAAPEAGPTSVLEVAEIAGQPGTVVETGAAVVRVVDVSRPLVRLDLPVESVRAGPPPSGVDLWLVAPPSPALRGAANRPEAAQTETHVRAEYVGPVSQADPASQFIGYYYAVRPADGQPPLHRVWRPGVFVRAHVPGLDTETDAVVVPETAVLYHQGRALVYVKTAADKYERREVQVLGFRDDRCYLAPRSLLAPPTVGVAVGDKVVSSGAQVLLSTEFRKDTDDD
jgi:hypothetical protein